MKKLYIDFDGVILDTNTKLYEEAKKQHYDKNDNEFYKNFDFKTILNDEIILNDSINSIKKILDSNLFDVSILTHCSSFKEGIDKMDYIRKYFKDISIVMCPKEVSKSRLVHSKNAILIDDYKGNLEEWASEGGIPIKFSKYSTSNDFTAIDRLDKIIEMF